MKGMGGHKHVRPCTQRLNLSGCLVISQFIDNVVVCHMIIQKTRAIEPEIHRQR